MFDIFHPVKEGLEMKFMLKDQEGCGELIDPG